MAKTTDTSGKYVQVRVSNEDFEVLSQRAGADLRTEANMAALLLHRALSGELVAPTPPARSHRRRGGSNGGDVTTGTTATALPPGWAPVVVQADTHAEGTAE